MKYRKKPVVIDAWQLPDGKNADLQLGGWAVAPPWVRGIVYVAEDGNNHIDIKTLEGTMRASPGDWIIRGIKGEFYPCKPDIFEATYELVEGQS